LGDAGVDLSGASQPGLPWGLGMASSAEFWTEAGEGGPQRQKENARDRILRRRGWRGGRRFGWGLLGPEDSIFLSSCETLAATLAWCGGYFALYHVFRDPGFRRGRFLAEHRFFFGGILNVLFFGVGVAQVVDGTLWAKFVFLLPIHPDCPSPFRNPAPPSIPPLSRLT